MITDVDKRVRDEIKKSQISSVIHLSHCRFSSFPKRLLQSAQDLGKLRRLDLSFNNISHVPKEISLFVELRELWLQHNAIETLPVEIEQCIHLEVIDIKSTRVMDLPPEVCNLKKLHTLDFSETPFAEAALQRYNIKQNNLTALKKIFNEIYTRNCLKDQMYEKLVGEVYVRESDNPNYHSIIKELVQSLEQAFPLLDEFKLFARRVDKLLPESLADIDDILTIEQTKEKFRQLHANTKRDRMAAEVEIKLRNIYFDRIERTAVESVIASIYQHVKSLEDMQFLVKYATQVFPPTPAEADGATIWKNIVALQADLRNKRELAIKSVTSAMIQLYPEQIPADVEIRAREVAAVFAKERFATKRELNTLSQIAADAAQILPPDFVSVDPSGVAAQVRVIHCLQLAKET